jgi:hypothetical protein
MGYSDSENSFSGDEAVAKMEHPHLIPLRQQPHLSDDEAVAKMGTRLFVSGYFASVYFVPGCFVGAVGSADLLVTSAPLKIMRVETRKRL